jgi:hypothetical protein
MRFFLGISLGAIICLALLEGLLRFMPVNSGLRMEATSTEKPFSRYLPHEHYVYSYSWSMGTARSGDTNSLGFANSPDSSEKGGVFVVGDSYIESFMLDFPDTVQGHLAETFPNKVQTASASGNNLADSLQIIKYFTPKIQPAVVVLFVEPFDLLSLLEKPDAGHNGFFVMDETNVSLEHNPYTESPNKQLLSHSALIRYLYYNLKFSTWASKALMSIGDNAPHTVSNTDGLSTRKELVLNYYFSELRALSSVNGFRVVFLLDGDRKAIYSDNREQAWNSNDRQLFSKLALQYGLDVVDMQPVFKHHWDEKRERMDFLPMDGHWNPVAHKLAADEIIKLLNTK